MNNKLIKLTLLILVLFTKAALAEQAITFSAASGESVAAFKGSFTVPENRSKPDSREIEIHYVRFPTTSDKPGSPIVYLSGGPGGSGIQTAKNRRFPMFMAMREFGDVIALDQRGTGEDHDSPICRSSITLASDVPVSDADEIKLRRAALTECTAFWEDAGLDIYGYTTLESVADLEALRNHLNVDRLSLWGISYGTHLALAAMKTMSDRLDRIILATVEGLRQTIKQPARTDQYFDRLQLAINSDEQLRTQFPDIKALIRRVHTSLEKKPLLLTLAEGEKTKQVFFVKRDMQQFTAGAISDPAGALQILQLYHALDHGVTEPLGPLVQQYGNTGAPISFRPMSAAMDLASGQSQKHYQLVMDQAKTALLGSQLNSSIHLSGVIPGLDLGKEFREPPVSDVPTLVLRGTLDGRIYPDSQLEATAGLTQRQVVTVINAGHNLFMTSPEVTEVMRTFMRSEVLKQTEITVDLPW